jgi:hypothetical protein
MLLSTPLLFAVVPLFQFVSDRHKKAGSRSGIILVQNFELLLDTVQKTFDPRRRTQAAFQYRAKPALTGELQFTNERERCAEG